MIFAIFASKINIITMKKLILLLALLAPMALCNAQENEDFDAEATLQKACENTLRAWNKALNNRDRNTLDTLYSAVVIYYQSFYTNEQVSDSHTRFFKKNAYYHQYYDNVEVGYINGCQAMLIFDKHVKTDPNADYKTYRAYLHFVGWMDLAYITEEGDTTTDEYYAKRQQAPLNVDNNTKLEEVFCDKNVDKSLYASYWDLVEMGEKPDGPLADLIMTTGFPRSYIDGTIKKGFGGQKGTYYVGGHAVGGECRSPVIFVYNPTTKQMYCVGSGEE